MIAIFSTLRTMGNKFAPEQKAGKCVKPSITHDAILLKFGRLVHYGSTEAEEWLRIHFRSDLKMADAPNFK